MNCLDEGFEAAMTVMALPSYLHKYFRTSNHIERLNKELKRRSKVIGVFPNEDSLMRLMGSVLLKRNEAIALNRSLFKEATYAKFITADLQSKLAGIAEEQQTLLAARQVAHTPKSVNGTPSGAQCAH